MANVQELLERARGGDHRAFTQLVVGHDRALRALAYRLLGDADRMDDVLQDAYLKAYRALPRFRGDAAVGTWLHRIVYNACLDQLRRDRTVLPLPLDRVPADRLADDGPAPGDRLADRDRLATALATLPPDQRAVVVLIDAEGMDHADVADVLDLPPGTVRSRLSRARARLRTALTTDDERTQGGGQTS